MTSLTLTNCVVEAEAAAAAAVVYVNWIGIERSRCRLIVSREPNGATTTAAAAALEVRASSNLEIVGVGVVATTQLRPATQSSVNR